MVLKFKSMKNSKIIIGALLVGGIAYFFLRKKKTISPSSNSIQDESAGDIGGGAKGKPSIGVMPSANNISVPTIPKNISGKTTIANTTTNLSKGITPISEMGTQVNSVTFPTLGTTKGTTTYPTMSSPKGGSVTYPTMSSPKGTTTYPTMSSPKGGSVTFPTMGNPKENFLTFGGSYRQSASHFFDGNLE